jgi:hypothetical protein
MKWTEKQPVKDTLIPKVSSNVKINPEHTSHDQVSITRRSTNAVQASSAFCLEPIVNEAQITPSLP